MDATLLLAPLTTGPAMDISLSGRCTDLALAIDRLKLLAAHAALILLKASFSAPQILHILRSAPCAGHPDLDRFDGLLETGLSLITNSSLSDLQGTQASLPIKEGGRGVRTVASPASCAVPPSVPSH